MSFVEQPAAGPSVRAAHPRGERYLVLAAFIVIAVATLAPAWSTPGWPANHDGPGFAQRTHIYARHLSQFDLLPIWSSVDVSGFGSPMPLFYHRLFYLMAGPLALLTGSIRFAVLATLVVALVLGAAGLARLTRELGASRLPSAVAGGSLIAANYTVTSWLVRGTVAELTAAMLVPWVLTYFVRALKSGRIPTALGLTLALLWHGHSVMAYYTVLILSVTFLLLAAQRPSLVRLLDPRTAWRSVALFTLLVTPHVVAMTIAGSRYDLSRFLSWPLHPSYQFRPIVWYFWDRHWAWGHTASGLTLQIDLAMLSLLVVGLLAFVGRRPVTAGALRGLAPVAVPAALCLVLQMHWTEGFYVNVPGAAYIQFPWRLLAILTPCLVALAVVLADRTLPHDARLLALAASGAWMLAGSGAFVPLVDGRLPLERPSLRELSFSGYREYEPASAPPLSELRASIERRWLETGCSVTRDDPYEEQTVVVFDATCERAAVVPLPIYASVFHRVEVSTFARISPCAEVPGVPSVCGATLPAGQSIIRVHMPTMLDVPTYLARRVAGRAGTGGSRSANARQ